MFLKLAVPVYRTALHYRKGGMRPFSMFFAYSIKLQTITTFPHTKFSIFNSDDLLNRPLYCKTSARKI